MAPAGERCNYRDSFRHRQRLLPARVDDQWNRSSPKRSVIPSSHERGHEHDERDRTAASLGVDAGVRGGHHAGGGSGVDGHLAAPCATAQGSLAAGWARRPGPRQSRPALPAPHQSGAGRAGGGPLPHPVRGDEPPALRRTARRGRAAPPQRGHRAPAPQCRRAHASPDPTRARSPAPARACPPGGGAAPDRRQPPPVARGARAGAHSHRDGG